MSAQWRLWPAEGEAWPRDGDGPGHWRPAYSVSRAALGHLTPHPRHSSSARTGSG